MRLLRSLLILTLLPHLGCSPSEKEAAPDGVVQQTVFTEQEKQAVEARVRAFIEELYHAWNEGSYDHAFSLYEHPSGLFGTEPMASWDAQMAREQENLALMSRFTQRLDTLMVKPLSPDAAVVIGKDHYEAVYQTGQQQKGSTTFTLVLARRDSTWRIVHFHVVDSPPLPLSESRSPAPFSLVPPDMQRIREELARSPGTSLYIYLRTHYTALGSWQKIQEFDGELCEFRQRFAPDMDFYQQACSPGTEICQLILPAVGIGEIKKLMAQLYENEEYHWSADSLSYKSSPDGLSGSGCEFSYKYQNSKIGMSIACFD